MSLLEKGRAVGYTASQVRAVIKEQRELVQKEKHMKEVLECNSIEDLKILLLDWLDKGLVK